MVKEALIDAFKRLHLKFDKKAWLKQHRKKKAACPFCGSVVCRHMMKRHLRTRKCAWARAKLAVKKVNPSKVNGNPRLRQDGVAALGAILVEATPQEEGGLSVLRFEDL